MTSTVLLSEQRRRKILENQQSRINRILGMAGENATVGNTRSRLPVIDGFCGTNVGDQAPAGKMRDDVATDETTDNSELLSRGANKMGDQASTISSTGRLSNESKKGDLTHSVPQRQPAISWLRDHRRLMALLLGTVLRLALSFSLLSPDTNFLPFVVAVCAVFETGAAFSSSAFQGPAGDQNYRTLLASYISLTVARLKAFCWRLFDCCMYVLCGFILLHLSFSLLG